MDLSQEDEEFLQKNWVGNHAFLRSSERVFNEHLSVGTAEGGVPGQNSKVLIVVQ